MEERVSNLGKAIKSKNVVLFANSSPIPVVVKKHIYLPNQNLKDFAEYIISFQD